MRIYDIYIYSLALFLTLTTVILAAFGESRLDVYFTAYLIETLVLTELYIHLNPRARRGLSVVSVILFAGFIGIITLAIPRILG